MSSAKRQRALWFVGGATVVISAACSILFLFFYHEYQIRRVAYLLSVAYGEHRSLELRISGADHRPLQSMGRSADGSPLTRSSALRQAESMLAQMLSERSDDSAVLQMSARANLLNRDYNSALLVLDNLLNRGIESPSIQIDLASAYFERGENEGRPSDLGKCIELLTFAINSIGHEDEDVAVFNRALVAEKLYMYAQAEHDWRRFLQIGVQPGWLQEARVHLEAVLQQGARALATVTDLTDSTLINSISHQDGMVEVMLNVAVTQWAPRYFSPAESLFLPDSQAVSSSLSALSDAMVKNQQDWWLADFIKAPRTETSAAGSLALAKAIEENRTDSPGEALIDAERAASTFAKVRNTAGELRSRMEKVYALHRSARGPDCVSAAISLSGSLTGRRYHWLEAQLAVEESICKAMVEDFAGAQIALDHARDLAKTYSYPTLYLRVLGIAAAQETTVGNYFSSWEMDRKGLAIYWQGAYPAERAFQFYSDLAVVCEDQQRWDLALMFAREALRMVSLTPYLAAQAMAHHNVGRLAALTGAPQEATVEFDFAHQLLFKLPPSASRHLYEIDDEVSEAFLAAETGQLGDRISRLEALRPEVIQVGDFPIALRFYRTLGISYLRAGNYEAADIALNAALAIAEQGRQSLSTQRERLTWQRSVVEPYRTLIELKLKRSDNIGALELWERYRAAGLISPYGLRQRPTIPDFSHLEKKSKIPVSGVQHLLPTLTGVTVISYVRLSDNIRILAFDNRGIQIQKVDATPSDVERTIREFTLQCSDPRASLEAIQRNARQLYRWLIGPVAAWLDSGRTLLIEADGLLGAFPIGALMDEDGVYFGQNFTVMISPGVLFHSSEKHAVIDRDTPALVVASPSLGHLSMRFTPLPDAIREGEETAARFVHSMLLTGNSATKRAVQRELMHAELFHFAGHSIIFGRGGGLLVARDANVKQDYDLKADLFSAESLTPGRIRHPRLVVLSACSTAVDERSGPINPDSLVQAFLSVGFENVVASNWDVDSLATATFMKAFYDQLLTGSSVPDSVRIAAAKLRVQRPTAHPYYWASFVAYGGN